MTITILVDSNEFWKSLKTDVSSASKYVYLQTLSFEGDYVGKQLSDLLLSSNSYDRRLLIDSFTKYVLSDKFLYAPHNLSKSTLRHEASETNRLIRLLNNNSVKVKFTNPVGPALKKFVRRNHKKFVVIDDRIAYIGGINFSEHNFYWHDMMLRIEDSDIALFLKKDFLSTWDGQNQNISKQFGEIQFHLFDGYRNEAIVSEIFKIMETAKERIIIESPYLTSPFFEKLREIKRKGVLVTIIAPESNNRKFFDKYTRWESKRSGFDLRLYQDRMTHLKAMLIDDNYLLVGSSNFEFMSYLLQEMIAVITNSDVISNFKDKIFEEDLRNSINFECSKSNITGYVSFLRLKLLEKLLVSLSNIW